MKQLFIILSLTLLNICMHIKVMAASPIKNDSAFSVAMESQLDEVGQLLFNTYAEHELKSNSLQTLSVQQRKTILGRFFRWIGEFFEPVWGKYREPGRRTRGPYMVFQYNQFTDLQIKVDTIRNRIVNKAYGYDKLYYEIFKIARDGQTVNCSNKGDVCSNANTAKCAAFVYIIGIEWVDADTIYGLSEDDNFTPFTNAPLRDSYCSKVENILLNVDVPGLNNALDAFAAMPLIAQITIADTQKLDSIVNELAEVNLDAVDQLIIIK